MNVWLAMDEYLKERIVEIEENVSNAIDGFLVTVAKDYHDALATKNPGWALEIRNQCQDFLREFIEKLGDK